MVVQIVNFINDTILTLLLMLMMLGTREGCVLLHKRPQPCWPALAERSCWMQADAGAGGERADESPLDVCDGAD